MKSFRIPSRVLNDEDNLDQNYNFVDSDQTLPPSDTSSESEKEDCETNIHDITRMENEVVIIVDENGDVKQTRTQMRVIDVWQLENNLRVLITTNEIFQPINKSASTFAAFLGSVARDCTYCPLNHERWQIFPEDLKKQIEELVLSKFTVDTDSCVTKYFIKSVGNKWKNHKSRLKAAYMKPGMTEVEVKRTVPKYVNQDQWNWLVHYWFSPKGKKCSRDGKKARFAQTTPHTTGSKSFARKRKEFVKEHGREPGRLEFYGVTHRNKAGKYVNTTVEDIMDKGANMLAEHVSKSSSSSANVVHENQVFTDLFGLDKSGRVKGFGFGVTPTQVFGRNSQSSSSQSEEVILLRQQVDELTKKLTSYEEFQRNMQLEFESMSQFVKKMETSKSNMSNQDNDGSEGGPNIL